MKRIKIFIITFLIIAMNSICYSSDVSKAHTYLDGEVLTAALLNASVDEIIVELNDIDSDNLASNIAITTSGASTFSGTFTTTGSTLLGNGADTLTINNSSGITYTPAATWTFTGAQTVSGTWANLGTVTTVDINGGTIDGVTIGASTAGNITANTLTAGGLVVTADVDIGTYELRANTFESDVATGTAPFTIASTTVSTNLNADTVDGASSSNGVSGVFMPSGALFYMVTGSCPSGTTDVTATYSNKFVRINATGGSTGGADTHTQTFTLAEANLPSHTHPSGTLTVGNESAHTHNMTGVGTGSGSGTNVYIFTTTSNNIQQITGGGSAHTHTLSGSTAATGSGTEKTTSAGDNVPAYVTAKACQVN